MVAGGVRPQIKPKHAFLDDNFLTRITRRSSNDFLATRNLEGTIALPVSSATAPPGSRSGYNDDDDGDELLMIIQDWQSAVMTVAEAVSSRSSS